MDTYIGVWLDHRKAHIVSLNKSAHETEIQLDKAIITIESGVEKHVRLSGGARSGKTPYGPQDVAVEGKMEDRRKHQLHDYYQQIVRRIQDAKKIFILGPGEAKGELSKEIKKSKALAAKLVAVETADKMTENQLAAKVKAFFIS